MTDTNRTTPALKSATPEIPVALTKADQMAWEAPELRPILHVLNDEPMGLSSECPDWCTGDGVGHLADDGMFQFSRLHDGPELCIRTDYHWPYWVGNDAAWAHLALRLVRGNRGSLNRIRIEQRYGDQETGQLQSFNVADLYLDEARELIAVLQHLLKVGQA